MVISVQGLVVFVGGVGRITRTQQVHRRALSIAAKRSKVVVVGGGFGGLYTALKLKDQEKTVGGVALDVTLVDAKDKFVFLPLLYELATGTASAVEASGADAMQCGRHCVPNTSLTPFIHSVISLTMYFSRSPPCTRAC